MILPSEDFIRIVFVESVSRLSGEWQYSHAHKTKTTAAKEVVKKMFSCRIYDVI